MKTEIWKAVKGYYRIYEVSNMGRVRSLDRVTVHKNGFKQKMKGQILKHATRNLGSKTPIYYCYVNLSKNGKCKTFFVHQLVANAFIKIKPKKCKYEVMHLDNDGTNNCKENLRYGSHSCNSAFRVENGTSIRGEQNPNSKLTKKDIIKIRKLHKQGVKQKDIASQFNVTYKNINYIILGKGWNWL